MTIITSFEKLLTSNGSCYENVVSIINKCSHEFKEELQLPNCKSFTIITNGDPFSIGRLVLPNCENFHVCGLNVKEVVFGERKPTIEIENSDIFEIKTCENVNSFVLKNSKFPSIAYEKFIGTVILDSVRTDNDFVFKNAKNLEIKNCVQRNNLVSRRKLEQLKLENCIFSSVFFTRAETFSIENCEIEKYLMFSSAEEVIYFDESNKIATIIGDEENKFKRRDKNTEVDYFVRCIKFVMS